MENVLKLMIYLLSTLSSIAFAALLAMVIR